MRTVALVGALMLLGTACFTRPGLAVGDASGDDAAPGDGGGSDVLPGGPYNVMFVTSDSREIWQVHTQAEADMWCEEKSTNLPPNTYRAWLSTTIETAPMRMGAARGWIRPDGQPVASTLSALISGNHLYPPRLDENANDVAASDPKIATGTSFMGQLAQNCGDLTSRGLDVQFGSPDAAAYLWTETATQACDESARIYCLGIDHANPINLQPDPNHRIAFISNQKQGLGGGVNALDLACQTEANSVPLAGTFRAAVALEGESIKSRFPDGQPWARRDGVVVIPADMSSIRAPIWLDANAQPLTALPDSAVVWTGASSFTEVGAGKTCNSWESTLMADQATVGFAVRSRMAYAIAEDMRGCNNQWRVYCLQM